MAVSWTACKGIIGMPRAPSACGTATIHCPACESSPGRGRVRAESPILQGKKDTGLGEQGNGGSASGERPVPP